MLLCIYVYTEAQTMTKQEKKESRAPIQLSRGTMDKIKKAKQAFESQTGVEITLRAYIDMILEKGLSK